MTSLELPCWVYGTDVSSSFLVTVLDTDNIIDLQCALERTHDPALRGVPASKLDLYSIPIADDDDDEEKLKEAMTHWTPEGKPHLFGLQRLSSMNLTDSLFVVCVPHLPVITVTCWALGDDVNRIFDVKMRRMDTVMDLKGAIKDTDPARFRDVGVPDLTLYKVSLPPGPIEGTFADLGLDKGEPLCPHHTMSSVSAGDFDIVIDAPIHHPVRPLPVNDIRTQRLQYLESNPPTDPSSAGTAVKFSSRQKDNERTIYCNRPAAAGATIPVTLLHPVFSQFLDDCKTHKITAEDNTLAMELSIAMSDFYTVDEDRAETIRAILARRGIPFTVSNTNQGYQADGDIIVNGHRCAISKFKSEVSGLGAEPYNQAILYYLESTRESAAAMTRMCLPCILIIVFGPYIAFAGAAWNLRPTVQTLSFVLPMHYHPTDTSMRIEAARHLGAFRKAIRTLEAYYQDITALDTLTSQAQSLFPYPTYFHSPRGDREDFEYTFQPFDGKLLFFATLSDKRRVCVKFTRQYSEDAHRECASLGFAPTLHAVEALPGGWIMVVMDRLLLEEYSMLSESRVVPELIETIRDKLEQLHGREYVHGDVRDANIMVSRTDETRFMLIDFDWAGKIGEARYPMNVNKFVWRPIGADDGALITTRHDLIMVNRIDHDYILYAKDCKPAYLRNPSQIG